MPWFTKSSVKSKEILTFVCFLVLKCDDEHVELQEDVERLGNSDVYRFKDSYITDHIKKGYFQTPTIPVGIKTFKITPDHTEMLLRTREFWMDIWSVKYHGRNPFLINVYSLVEQYEVFHIAMELAPSSLYLEVTNGTIKMPNDVDQVTSYLQNIAEAVGWLHKNYKPHYRISPKNVFIFQQEENLKIANWVFLTQIGMEILVMQITILI